MQIRRSELLQVVRTFLITWITLTQATAANKIPPSSPPSSITTTTFATAAAAETNDTATESSANKTRNLTTPNWTSGLSDDDSFPDTARPTVPTPDQLSDDYHRYVEYNYTFDYDFSDDGNPYETMTTRATTTPASDNIHTGELKVVMTTNAAITDDVTKMEKESMTSPINAEMSTNATEVTTSERPHSSNMSTTRVSQADNSTTTMTSYSSTVLTTTSPVTTVKAAEDEKAVVSSAFSPDRRTTTPLSATTLSPDDAGESPVTSTGNSTVGEMTVTDTWWTLSATREYDVNGSRDTNAEAGNGDASWAAEITAENVLVVILAVSIAVVIIVIGVYLVRACGSRDRHGYRKAADTEPLLGNGF